jgi:NmrA-like family
VPFESPAGVIQPTRVKLADFWYVEDGKIKEFNCYVSVSIMLEQMGIQPDFASAVGAHCLPSTGSVSVSGLKVGAIIVASERRWVMSQKLAVVVTGGTGKQGGAVVKSLLERGHGVRAVTRSTDSAKARELANAGVTLVRASLEDTAALTKALEGATSLFAMTTNSPTKICFMRVACGATSFSRSK